MQERRNKITCNCYSSDILMEVDAMKWQSICYYSKHETRAYVQSGEEVAVVVGVVYACSFLR